MKRFSDPSYLTETCQIWDHGFWHLIQDEKCDLSEPVDPVYPCTSHNIQTFQFTDLVRQIDVTLRISTKTLQRQCASQTTLPGLSELRGFQLMGSWRFSIFETQAVWSPYHAQWVLIVRRTSTVEDMNKENFITISNMKSTFVSCNMHVST